MKFAVQWQRSIYFGEKNHHQRSAHEILPTLKKLVDLTSETTDDKQEQLVFNAETVALGIVSAATLKAILLRFHGIIAEILVEGWPLDFVVIMQDALSNVGITDGIEVLREKLRQDAKREKI